MKTVSGLHPVRWVVLVGVAAWGWYLATMFRTSDWGYHHPWREIGRSLAIVGIFASPLAALALIGLPLRRFLAVLLLFTGVCLIGAEAFARSQEYLFQKRLGDRPAGTVTEVRWAPFAHHSIGYANGQWWGCD